MAYSFQNFIDSENSKNPHFLLVGNPIGHSLSPVMHNEALQHHQIEAEYYAVNLLPTELTSFISWCNNSEFRGCNITIPYKETLLNMVDSVDATAQEMGVINTIVKESDHLTGYNTDSYGFLKPLEPYLDMIEGGRAIIFGTGGSSKAVYHALIKAGIDEIVFVSRNPSLHNRANEDVLTRTVDYSNWHAFSEESSIIINCTPVGMVPNIDDSIISEDESALLKDKICYDLIYNPVRTKFLGFAAEAGGTPINGLDMLIYQGDRSFQLWTGKEFPFEKVRKKLKEYFNSK